MCRVERVPEYRPKIHTERGKENESNNAEKQHSQDDGAGYAGSFGGGDLSHIESRGHVTHGAFYQYHLFRPSGTLVFPALRGSDRNPPHDFHGDSAPCPDRRCVRRLFVRSSVPCFGRKNDLRGTWGDYRNREQWYLIR